MAFWHNETCEGCGHVVDSRSEKVWLVAVETPVRKHKFFYCGCCKPNLPEMMEKIQGEVFV